jgi:hypothetical protein
MAKKRTLCPFYTKRMQHMTAAARRSNDITLQMRVAGAIHDLLMRVMFDRWSSEWARRWFPGNGLQFGPAVRYMEARGYR